MKSPSSIRLLGKRRSVTRKEQKLFDRRPNEFGKTPESPNTRAKMTRIVTDEQMCGGPASWTLGISAGQEHRTYTFRAFPGDFYFTPTYFLLESGGTLARKDPAQCHPRGAFTADTDLSRKLMKYIRGYPKPRARSAACTPLIHQFKVTE
jgi:hypothetical protein